MFRKQFRQVCRKCSGTGTTKIVLKNKDGQTIFAPEYHDPHDKRRPQFEMCKECDSPGSGMAMYDSPHEIQVDGAKVKLEQSDRAARFNDTPLSANP